MATAYPIDSRTGVEPYLIYLDRELDKDAEVDERGLSTRVSDWFIGAYMARLGLPILPAPDDPYGVLGR